MLFYKVTGIMEANEAPEEDRRVRRENQRKIEMKSEEFNRNHSSNSFYLLTIRINLNQILRNFSNILI